MQHASKDIGIGIDVGATRTRVAAVDRVGGVLAIRRWRTPCGDSADGMLSRIARNIKIVHEEAGVGAGAAIPVAIALPGPLARDRRSIVRSVNLSVLEGRPIVSELAPRIGSAFGEPKLYTDAEAATWGEYASRGLCVGQAGVGQVGVGHVGGPPLQRWGTRIGCRFVSPTAKAMGHPASPTAKAMGHPTRGSAVFVHLRLGTGVACGIVMDGELQRREAGRSTHLDVLVVDDRTNARLCSCGRHGCLDTIASGAVLEERARELGYANGITGLQQAWEEGADSGRCLVRQAADALEVAINNLTMGFRPYVICLGGGVTEHLPALLAELRNGRDDECGRKSSRAQAHGLPALQLPLLGDNAGVIGAALLAMRRSRPTPGFLPS